MAITNNKSNQKIEDGRAHFDRLRRGDFYEDGRAVPAGDGIEAPRQQTRRHEL
jgi:hypothetical protein